MATNRVSWELRAYNIIRFFCHYPHLLLGSYYFMADFRLTPKEVRCKKLQRFNLFFPFLPISYFTIYALFSQIEILFTFEKCIFYCYGKIEVPVLEESFEVPRQCITEVYDTSFLLLLDFQSSPLRLCTPQKKVDKKGVGLIQFWSRDLPLFAYRREKGIPALAGVVLILNGH